MNDKWKKRLICTNHIHISASDCVSERARKRMVLYCQVFIFEMFVCLFGSERLYTYVDMRLSIIGGGGCGRGGGGSACQIFLHGYSLIYKMHHKSNSCLNKPISGVQLPLSSTKLLVHVATLAPLKAISNMLAASTTVPTKSSVSKRVT